MLNRDLSYLDQEKKCPHCEQKMSCCEAPPIHIGDGLGWGSDVLFICLNDFCPIFLKGWEKIEVTYGHHASYRYMELPDSTESNYMMVGNSDAFKASVINKETLLEQNRRYQEEKKAMDGLKTCVAENNLKPVLYLLTDEAANIDGRKEAAGKLLEINNLNCIDPLRNHTFRNTDLEMEVNKILIILLQKNFKKECPYCGELIKLQAKKCMHCKEEL